MRTYKLRNREVGKYYYSRITSICQFRNYFSIVICHGFDAIGQSKSRSCGVYFYCEKDAKEYVDFKNGKLK